MVAQTRGIEVKVRENGQIQVILEVEENRVRVNRFGELRKRCYTFLAGTFARQASVVLRCGAWHIEMHTDHLLNE